MVECNPALQLINDKDYHFAEQESDFFSLSTKQESDLPSLPVIECLEYAFCTYHKAVKEYELYVQSLQPKEKPSMAQPTYRGFARLYNINHTTLMRRYKGETQALEKVLQHWQCLTPAEEASVVDWILQLESWNFPPFVSQVRELTKKILKKRKNFEPLRIHWPQKFLSRHPEISS